MEKTVLTQTGAKIQEDLNFTEKAFPAFSSSATYDLDDIVRYEDKLYRCHTAVSSAGGWTGATNWVEYQFKHNASRIFEITTNITQLSSDFVSKLKAGDIVVRKGQDDAYFYETYIVQKVIENYRVILSNLLEGGITEVSYKWENNAWSYYETEYFHITEVEANSGTPSNVLNRIKINGASYSIAGFTDDIKCQYDPAQNLLSIDTTRLPNKDTMVRLVDYLDTTKAYGYATIKYDFNTLTNRFFGFIGDKYFIADITWTGQYTSVTLQDIGGGDTAIGFDYDVEVRQIVNDEYSIRDGTSSGDIKSNPDHAIVRLVYNNKSIGFMEVTYNSMDGKFYVVGFVDGGIIEQSFNLDFGSHYLKKKSLVGFYKHSISLDFTDSNNNYQSYSIVAVSADATEYSLDNSYYDFNKIISVKQIYDTINSKYIFANVSYYEWNNSIGIIGFDANGTIELTIPISDVTSLTDSVTPL